MPTIHLVVYEKPVYKHPGYFVSSTNPDSVDWDMFENNSVWIDVIPPKVAHIEAGIMRNVLVAAGASVIMS